MLNSEIIKKIEDFVYQKPRSTQEIAQVINKNWRTADRYIAEIEKEFGILSTRTFREGTRGALKIVYWSSVEKVSSSVFQEKLENDINNSKKKDQFYPFDIFQYVNDKKKEAYIERTDSQKQKNLSNYAKLLQSTEKQILIFSGNLSFINEKSKEYDIFSIFESLVKRKIPIKIICRVDLAGKENVKRMLSLNFKYNVEMVQIRHNEQPLRGAIIDMKNIRLKEIAFPSNEDIEQNKSTSLVYFIKDKDWAEWLSRIFWKKFSTSIDANTRLEQMQKIKF